MRNEDGRFTRSVRPALAVACLVALAACSTTMTGTARRGTATGQAPSSTVPSGTVPTSSTTRPSPTEPSNPITEPTSTPTAPSGPGTAPSGPGTSPSTVRTPESAAEPSSLASAVATPSAVTSWPVTPGTVAEHSIATVSSKGVITVRTPGQGDRLVLDEYEEPICPPCGQFQSTYGEQIARAIEDGKLTVRYRVATFLDDRSASGDYSTRALAAMLAVATTAGDQPGLFQAFHAMLYSNAVQPEEDGATDLTNAQLAALARQAGAPEDTARAIEDGTQLQLAQDAGARTFHQIQTSIASRGVPAVLVDGTQVSTSDPGWLATLLQG